MQQKPSASGGGSKKPPGPLTNSELCSWTPLGAQSSDPNTFPNAFYFLRPIGYLDKTQRNADY